MVHTYTGGGFRINLVWKWQFKIGLLDKIIILEGILWAEGVRGIIDGLPIILKDATEQREYTESEIWET